MKLFKIVFFFFFKMDSEQNVFQSTLVLWNTNKVLIIITQGKAFVVTYD